MSRFLSWFEPGRLAAALARAGLDPGRPLRPLAQTSARPLGLTAPAIRRPLPVPAGWAGSPGRSFTPRSEGLGERLAELSAWAHGCFSGEGLVVLDEDGLTLFDSSSDDEIVSYVAALIHLAARVGESLQRPAPERWSVEFGGGRHLHIATITTDLGSFTVSLLNTRPLIPTELAALGDGLRAVLAPSREVEPPGADA